MRARADSSTATTARPFARSPAAKSTKKKAKKDDDEVEEDIEKILAQLAADDARKTAVHVTAVERPSARANFSMCALPSGEQIIFGGEFFDGARNTCYNELYRFMPPSAPAATTAATTAAASASAAAGSAGGGAAATAGAAPSGGAGTATTATATPSTAAAAGGGGSGDWKLISSPNTPAHRCSHQAVLMNAGGAYTMYVTGGEFATNNQFHHYGDTVRH